MQPAFGYILDENQQKEEQRCQILQLKTQSGNTEGSQQSSGVLYKCHTEEVHPAQT